MNHAIPLVDLRTQYDSIRDEVEEAMRRVLESSAFILGPDVAAFEEEFAAYCGAPHCVGVSSGTAALELALRALGVGPGHEVITTTHTFIATAEAISAVGARPVFVDIDSRTYNIDPDACAAAVTPATRALLPVHLYGQPADMVRLQRVAADHGLALVEDAAQAHGAAWQGQPVGARGDAACYSFYPGKNLGAYGDAGAVTCADPALDEQVRLLRNHGRRSKYLHEQIGFGERLDTLQAAVLRVKLRRLAEWTAARRRLAARYSALLAGSGLALPAVTAGAEPVWHLYVVRTPRRDALLSHLKAQGIGAGVHYPVPLHLQPAYAGLGYRRGALPISEEVAATCLSLPLYPEMSDSQQDRVVGAVLEFMQQAEPAWSA